MRSAACGLSLILLFAGCAGGAVVELPRRDAGLWEVTLVDEGARRPRPVVTRECTSAEVDARLLLSLAPGQEHCAAPDVRRTDSGWEVRTACRVHDNRIDTSFTLSGDFRTGYSGSYDVRYRDACPRNLPGCREARAFSARRLGDCPADMRPGDRLLPNGIVIHALPAEAHDHEH